MPIFKIDWISGNVSPVIGADTPELPQYTPDVSVQEGQVFNIFDNVLVSKNGETIAKQLYSPDNLSKHIFRDWAVSQSSSGLELYKLQIDNMYGVFEHVRHASTSDVRINAIHGFVEIDSEIFVLCHSDIYLVGQIQYPSEPYLINATTGAISDFKSIYSQPFNLFDGTPRQITEWESVRSIYPLKDGSILLCQGRFGGLFAFDLSSGEVLWTFSTIDKLGPLPNSSSLSNLEAAFYISEDFIYIDDGYWDAGTYISRPFRVNISTGDVEELHAYAFESEFNWRKDRGTSLLANNSTLQLLNTDAQGPILALIEGDEILASQTVYDLLDSNGVDPFLQDDWWRSFDSWNKVDADGALLWTWNPDDNNSGFFLKISVIENLISELVIQDLVVAEDLNPDSTIALLSADSQVYSKPVDYGYIYELIDIEGVQHDNHLFSIEGNRLVTGSIPFDYEDKNEHEIYVRITDTLGNVQTSLIPVAIEDVPERPSLLSLEHESVSENVPLRTSVGRIYVEDEDIDDSHRFELIAHPDDEELPFEVVDGSIVVSGELDYESLAEYKFSIRAIDSYGLDWQQEFTLNILDVNEAHSLLLGSHFVFDGVDAGSFVSTLLAIDEDADESHSFYLVNGEGSDHNHLFNISGSDLFIKESPTASFLDEYSLRIRAVDGTNSIC